MTWQIWITRDTTVAELIDSSLIKFYASDFVELSRVQLWLSYADRGGLIERPLSELDELILPTFLQFRRDSLRLSYTARITVQIVCPVTELAHHKIVRITFFFVLDNSFSFYPQFHNSFFSFTFSETDLGVAFSRGDGLFFINYSFESLTINLYYLCTCILRIFFFESIREHRRILTFSDLRTFVSRG